MKKILPFTVSNNLFYSDGTVPIAIIFKGDQVLVRQYEGKIFLPCTVEKEFAELPEIAGPALCVGRFEDGDCGAWEIGEDTLWHNPCGTEFVEIRRAMFELDAMSVKALARAKELLFWRKKRHFCGFCGKELADNENDISRICPDCGNAFYPVLAPAIIVAVRRDNKLLLAHNARFKGNIYGLVAGFVEAGENLESAVVREVKEEIGIDICNIKYFASQVWPFPNSLMVGFTADHAGGEIKVDGREITDADWFSADALPEIPRHGSIARRLIDHWLETAGR